MLWTLSVAGLDRIMPVSGLCSGKQHWAQHHNELSDMQLQKLLGKTWSPANKFCLPTEVQHQLRDGLGDPFFAFIRSWMNTCELHELGVGVRLGEALQAMDAFRSFHACTKRSLQVFLSAPARCSSVLQATARTCTRRMRPRTFGFLLGVQSMTAAGLLYLATCSVAGRAHVA